MNNTLHGQQSPAIANAINKTSLEQNIKYQFIFLIFYVACRPADCQTTTTTTTRRPGRTLRAVILPLPCHSRLYAALPSSIVGGLMQPVVGRLGRNWAIVELIRWTIYYQKEYSHRGTAPQPPPRSGFKLNHLRFV